jgi:hypothetical protein
MTLFGLVLCLTRGQQPCLSEIILSYFGKINYNSGIES